VETDAGPGFLTSCRKDGRFDTCYGDNHPIHAGSVVKAMASVKDGFHRADLRRTRPTHPRLLSYPATLM